MQLGTLNREWVKYLTCTWVTLPALGSHELLKIYVQSQSC